MGTFVGLDVSRKATSICVSDETGARVFEGKAIANPAVLTRLFRKRAPEVVRVGFESGPTSAWLCHTLTRAGVPAVCLDARHAQPALSVRPNMFDERRPASATPPQRRGPVGAMSDAALTAAIRAVLSVSPFHGEGHRKVWARLRYAGTRTSLRRVLRLMRENDLLAPGRVGSPRGPRSHDGTIVPETIDTMWGTDLTTTFTGEGPAAVFIAVDHCSAECVGVHAGARATRFEAPEPVCEGVRRHFDGFAADIARGLAMRYDHGSQYMSDHFPEGNRAPRH